MTKNFILNSKTISKSKPKRKLMNMILKLKWIKSPKRLLKQDIDGRKHSSHSNFKNLSLTTMKLSRNGLVDSLLSTRMGWPVSSFIHGSIYVLLSRSFLYLTLLQLILTTWWHEVGYLSLNLLLISAFSLIFYLVSLLNMNLTERRSKVLEKYGWSTSSHTLSLTWYQSFQH